MSLSSLTLKVSRAIALSTKLVTIATYNSRGAERLRAHIARPVEPDSVNADVGNYQYRSYDLTFLVSKSQA